MYRVKKQGKNREIISHLSVIIFVEFAKIGGFKTKKREKSEVIFFLS